MHPFYNKPSSYPPLTQFRNPEQDYQEEETVNCLWYDPPKDSLPVEFCLDTTLHGLQYLGQPRRHLIERILWLALVIAAVSASAVLILGLYRANKEMPIITVFNPTEKTIDEIPFPAVTICNVNNVQKSKLYNLIGKANHTSFASEEEAAKLYAKLLDIVYICDSGETFSKKFLRHSVVGKIWAAINKLSIFKKNYTFEKYSRPAETLKEISQPCKEMIKLCLWLDEIKDCSDLFQEIETDYGYCCSFNTMPVSLLMRNDSRGNPERVQIWKDADLNYDNLMFTEKTKKDRKVPFRQLYPGKEAGLSVFLDADLDEYFCVNEDSKGFAVALHTPLDFPRIRDGGISVPSDSEVRINVRPLITLPDESLEQFSKETRQCYFGTEYSLPHYTKYTTANCMDECVAKTTKSECGCLLYYMPHPNSSDILCRRMEGVNCTAEVREKILKKGLGNACGHCYPTCTEIDYHAEISSLPIDADQADKLYKLYHNNLTLRHFFSKKHLSLVHIYFGTDSTYPRLRKESSSYTQLISDAGGILGLMLGFSILSVVEIIYYATLRLGCKWYRAKLDDKKKANAVILNFQNAAMKVYHANMFARNFRNPPPPYNDNRLFEKRFPNGSVFPHKVGGNINYGF